MVDHFTGSGAIVEVDGRLALKFAGRVRPKIVEFPIVLISSCFIVRYNFLQGLIQVCDFLRLAGKQLSRRTHDDRRDAARGQRSPRCLAKTPNLTLKRLFAVCLRIGADPGRADEIDYIMVGKRPAQLGMWYKPV